MATDVVIDDPHVTLMTADVARDALMAADVVRDDPHVALMTALVTADVFKALMPADVVRDDPNVTRRRKGDGEVTVARRWLDTAVYLSGDAVGNGLMGD